MCLAHPVSDANLWLILLRCVPMVPKRMCQVLPLRPIFWMLILVIYWFAAAFGRDRLILLLMFAWRTLTASLIGICHPEGSGTTRDRDEKEILQSLREPTSPFQTFRGIDGRNIRFRSPSISQGACKVACRRMGEALSNSKGFHQCPNEYRSS